MSSLKCRQSVLDNVAYLRNVKSSYHAAVINESTFIAVYIRIIALHARRHGASRAMHMQVYQLNVFAHYTVNNPHISIHNELMIAKIFLSLTHFCRIHICDWRKTYISNWSRIREASKHVLEGLATAMLIVHRAKTNQAYLTIEGLINYNK